MCPLGTSWETTVPAEITVVANGDALEDGAVHADVAALANGDGLAGPLPAAQPAYFGIVVVLLDTVDDCSGVHDSVFAYGDSLGR